MNQIDLYKILKMLGILVLVFAIVGTASHFRRKNSMTLEDYAKLHPELSETQKKTDQTPEEMENSDNSEKDSDGEDNADVLNDAPEDVLASDTPSTLTGALLNGGADGQAMLEQRITYSEAGAYPSDNTDASVSANTVTADFYYEPLSEDLKRYITGVSYPAGTFSGDAAAGDGAESVLAITYDDLRYVHILHYNFEGVATEGELICNAAIAQDLLEIFYELYRNEYRIEKVLLIDTYNGDDTASMEDNNTSCFNYRLVEGSHSLSKHALGLALDINPLYNPYITYNKDGSENVSPAAAADYADRNISFPYKIDENDLCYKLFTRHGFIWGGNWNSVKDYQHFQKTFE